jgi:hypothetical protein
MPLVRATRIGHAAESHGAGHRGSDGALSAVASWFSEEDSKVVTICVRTSYVIGIFAFADGMMSVYVIYLGLHLAYTLFFHTSLGVVRLMTGIAFGAITQMSCLLSNCTGRHVSSIFSLPAMRPLKPIGTVPLVLQVGAMGTTVMGTRREATWKCSWRTAEAI